MVGQKKTTGFVPVAGILLGMMTFTLSAAEHLVTNTADTGPGSLREAIQMADANEGPDNIIFQISEADPNFNADRGVWTISPLTQYVINDSGLVVNGMSQREFIGADSNPFGPEIEVTGSQASSYSDGFYISANRVQIQHLTINRFQDMGIYLHGTRECSIAGCYIGVNYNGMEQAGNLFGIFMDDSSHSNSVIPLETVPNIISGNPWGGIKIAQGSYNNFINGNYIGLNRTGTDTLGNGLIGGYGGVEIEDGSHHNEIIGNLICGNRVGIGIWDASSNFLMDNCIGTDSTWTLTFGNVNAGISIRAYNADSDHNVISGNKIGYHQNYGVYLEGERVRRTTITKNQISGNSAGGIALATNSNNAIPMPVISSVSAGTVEGTAGPASTIEVFTDTYNQARHYLGSVSADAAGAFTFDLTGQLLLEYITATATDTDGNTSMLSFPSMVSTEVTDGIPRPGKYVLEQNYPNPFNPETTLHFQISCPGVVELKIFDLQGRCKSTLIDGHLSAGEYHIDWAPVNLTSGVYFCRLLAGGFEKNVRMVYVK